MKKVFIILFALLVTGASAMNIALKDGRIYPNAVIMSSDTNGIWVQCADNAGNFYSRHIDYGALSTASFNVIQPLTTSAGNQTLFNMRQREQYLANQLPGQTKAEPYGGNFTKKTYTNVPGQPIILPGVPSHVQLDSIWIFGNGTIGWANSDPNFDDNIDYGRIYVYGIQIPQGVPWIGNVFPTNKTVTYKNWTLPCFAVTPETAQQINAQQW